MDREKGPGKADNRICREEALYLLQESPFLECGRKAFAEKQFRYGDQVTFVYNRQINPTNLCVSGCRFCDFSAGEGDSHAYILTEEEILNSIADPELREVHIVGGLHPRWDFTASRQLVCRIRETRPDLWIKAFTAVEIDWFARRQAVDTSDILAALRDAGADQLTGGGAEILSPRIHQTLFPGKPGPEAWIAIHRQAHQLGMPTNATMLFGHIESDEEIVDHLIRLRELQDETGGFRAFVPLVYQPGKTRIVEYPCAATRALRLIAVARLMLDNIPHIKAYWPTLGIETATAALTFGADDLDGTLGRERIMQLAGTESPAELTRSHMERIARHAGQKIVERDGAFRPVENTACAAEAGANP